MTAPGRAAAPGGTEGGGQIARRSEITNNSTRPVKRLGLDYGAAIDCSLACSADRRSRPRECPQIGATL